MRSELDKTTMHVGTTALMHITLYDEDPKPNEEWDVIQKYVDVHRTITGQDPLVTHVAAKYLDHYVIVRVKPDQFLLVAMACSSSAKLVNVLLDRMGAHNGCVFDATREQIFALRTAVMICETNGLAFTTEEIEEIVGGDVDEVSERFGGYTGYAQMSAILDQIHDGPNSCRHMVLTLDRQSCLHCGAQVSSKN